MNDTIDLELLDLINKLNRIQKDIGGSKSKDEVLVVGSDGNVDKFLDLRNQMVNQISLVKETLDTVRRLNDNPGLNPKDLITAQSKVRTELTSLNENWKELDNLYRNEAKKKRSKLSQEEMKLRLQMVTSLQMEIQGIRDIQRVGYVRGYQSVAMTTMEDSELFKPPSEDNKGNQLDRTTNTTGSRGVYGTSRNEMTDDHRFALQKLKERDLEIDDQIVEIGKGVDELREIALVARDEVKLQNRMLDTLQERVDDVHEHVVNINVKLKQILDETRQADKIFIDICCCMILIGMIIVIVEASKGKA